MSLSEPVILLPKKILLGNSSKTNPQISPNGTRIAYLAPVDTIMNIWLGTIGKDDNHPVTKDKEQGIWNYFWTTDAHHLLYLQDQSGNQNWHLYITNITTRVTRDLTPFDGVQIRVLSCATQSPNIILVTMNKDNPHSHDVYRLHVLSGEVTLVVRNPGNIVAWHIDTQANVRAGLATLPDGGFALVVRDTEDTAWHTIVTWDLDDAITSGIVGFAAGDQALYLEDSRNVDTSRLVKLDILTGKYEVIIEDPLYDIGSVMMHPTTHALQAVAFNRDRVEWTILDKMIAHDMERIRNIQYGDFFIAHRDSSDTKWILKFTTDIGPISYYLYDRSNHQATFIFDNQPELRQYPLAPMEPIALSSRDGLLLHGYLTVPPGQGKYNLPLVLYPHGGPWWRDSWGYNPDVQWFANRGYACLQVNFRGSTGYGKAFLNAGNKEWGAKMHDDLVDAVHWAIQQGLADPQRIAIYGGSYGGYAALVGAAFTPDLFCCAIAMCPISNLITFLNNLPPYAFLAPYYARVGHPETDANLLLARSPLFKAEQIKIPLLLAHGAHDPGIMPTQSEQIITILQRKNIPCEYLLFPDEGHGFVKSANRLQFYDATERFLARYLGGRYEQGADLQESCNGD